MDTVTAHGGGGYTDGGEGGGHELGDVEVIKADDAEVAGNLEADAISGAFDGDSGTVEAAEHGGGSIGEAEDGFSGDFHVLVLATAFEGPFGAEGEVCVL